MERSRFPHSFSATALSLIFIVFLLNACSGGSSSTAIPQTPNTTQTGPSGPTSSTNTTTTNLSITQADRTAATSAASKLSYHLFPVQKPGTTAAKKPASVNYPADLQYFGGAVVPNATSHNIFFNCAASCWGDPQTFLNSLDNSTFIHVTDQYVGKTANARYMTGPNAAINQTVYDNVISVGDMLSWIHHAATLFGSGYNHIYHVFLPQGMDTCFDMSSVCYSPDNFSTWVFCAYHGSAQFPDSVGHVLFTIEPYQNVPGCQENNTPNGSLVDSTATTLSHELIETITDPDPGSGWYNIPFNQEIADECAFFRDNDTLYTRVYQIQEEYSNKVHACVN